MHVYVACMYVDPCWTIPVISPCIHTEAHTHTSIHAHACMYICVQSHVEMFQMYMCASVSCIYWWSWRTYAYTCTCMDITMRTGPCGAVPDISACTHEADTRGGDHHEKQVHIIEMIAWTNESVDPYIMEATMYNTNDGLSEQCIIQMMAWANNL